MEFKAFPKLPRLNRPVVITEKIDGTNACIIIEQAPELGDSGLVVRPMNAAWPVVGDVAYNVGAQSRNRIITPEDDNAGFAKFVFENAAKLVELLGPGYHYGEWWGRKIARGYGLQERRFSLFNTSRWNSLYLSPVRLEGGTVTCVPWLAGLDKFDSQQIAIVLEMLKAKGSCAAPGFDRPEGIVVFHEAGGHLYKVLCENDELPKSVADKGQMPS